MRKQREFGEYHLDVRYITDTNEIIDLKKEMAWEERAKEPIGADDVILKITHAEGFEIERITNKTPEGSTGNHGCAYKAGRKGQEEYP